MRKLVKKCFDDSNNFMDKIKEAFDKKNKLFIVTLNPEGVMASLKNKELYEIYMRKNTLLVCESVAMQYAIKKYLRRISLIILELNYLMILSKV